jgi:protein-tyrosine-phosphatase
LKKVIFVCVHNSGRSQMAEAFARRLGAGKIAAESADRIITMGCGVDAEVCPAAFLPTEDWGIDDPKGQPIERVREIRDEIEQRVRALVEEMGSGQ